ncbi:MAG: helix-turn-helix domain-containing protein [Clostridiales bacterium]|nr:helix-turn-helix domain-containing protein [Clostridiales bacterium]
MAEMKHKKISYQEFLNREYEIFHAPYQEETEFFETIKSGNLKKTQQLLAAPFHKKEGFGTLSKDPLQNLKYHFTITTAMVARYCISGGMSEAESFSLSDYYIRLADEASSLSEVSEIHRDMCLNYADRMQKNLRGRIVTPAISLCINYIYEHLHTRITLPTLCNVTNLSGPYLSRLFKRETGYSISAYIQSKKLETAKSMLVNSDYSIAEISASLSFPSQSYFSNLLKKDCGLTPRQFRNQRMGRMTLDS